MNQLLETLFETYGQSELKALRCGFDEAALERWLAKHSVSPASRFHLLDDLFNHYYRWASASFGIGLRLGLALRESAVCRPEAERD